MDLIFNELSFYHKPQNEYQAKEILLNFAKVCSEAKKLGFSKVRIEAEFWSVDYFSGINLKYFISKINKTRGSFLRRFIVPPYLWEGNERADDLIIENDYFFNYEELINEKVVGFAYAYLQNTIAISFKSSTVWDRAYLDILEIKRNEREEEYSVKHISDLSHLDEHLVWIETVRPIILRKTSKIPNEKRIKLSPHHGYDVLLQKAKQLVKSDYVIAIINSIDHDSCAKNFIKQCYPNGEIDLVLTKTDKGFAMKIKTTGQNLRETVAIGKLLQEKYYK